MWVLWFWGVSSFLRWSWGNLLAKRDLTDSKTASKHGRSIKNQLKTVPTQSLTSTLFGLDASDLASHQHTHRLKQFYGPVLLHTSTWGPHYLWRLWGWWREDTFILGTLAHCSCQVILGYMLQWRGSHTCPIKMFLWGFGVISTKINLSLWDIYIYYIPRGLTQKKIYITSI